MIILLSIITVMAFVVGGAHLTYNFYADLEPPPLWAYIAVGWGAAIGALIVHSFG